MRTHHVVGNKNSKCLFSLLKLPTSRILITRTPNVKVLAGINLQKTRDIILEIKEQVELDNNHMCDEILHNIPPETYINCLNISHRGTCIT